MCFLFVVLFLLRFFSWSLLLFSFCESSKSHQESSITHAHSNIFDSASSNNNTSNAVIVLYNNSRKMREHTAFPKWINCGRRRYSYFIRCCAAYTFHHSPTLTPNPLSSSHTLASCTVEVCYRFFLFRPLILFALWTHIRWIWTDPYNPIMRAHKAHKAHLYTRQMEPMVLNLLLLCSVQLRLYVHISNTQHWRTLCVMLQGSQCYMLLAGWCCCCWWFFQRFSVLIGSGFSHRSFIYGNFHSDRQFMDTRRIFVFAIINISLQLLSA